MKKSGRNVRDELASRAAREGESEHLAARPSIHAWLERVRERKHAAGRRVSRTRILKHRDADRR